MACDEVAAQVCNLDSDGEFGIAKVHIVMHERQTARPVR